MDQPTTSMSVPADEPVSLNSETRPVRPGRQYRTAASVLSRKGEARSACLTAIVLDAGGREITRYVRWVTDFTGRPTVYTIVFTAPAKAKGVVVGYRFNAETPRRSDLELTLTDPASLALEEVRDRTDDRYDEAAPAPDVRPDASRTAPALSENEEARLERKMVWLFGAPRSGTTWLATQLLAHEDNITWNEPFIGYHLGALSEIFGLNPDPDWHRDTYFFSPRHKASWAPALRRLILGRTYAQAQGLDKNVLIKEPNGAAGAHLIMDCLPNSKVMFLLRDGRDVIDSLVDAHRPGSWNKELSRRPLSTPEKRLEAIGKYAESWKTVIQVMWKAFHDHNPDLRLLVRYQALKTDTPAELKRVYQFLDISMGDEAIQEIVNRHRFENLPEAAKGPGKFNRAATTGGWKTNFSKEEQELMNSVMGEALRLTGFEP